jgi:hypothetical protein
MKKFLPIIAFVSAVVASILYLLPGFTLNIKENTYVFTNLQSLSGDKVRGLQFDIAGMSPSFKYTIESATQVSDKDWNYAVAKDQKVLEERLESFIGRTFEVRADNRDGLAVFSVITQTSLSDNAGILTANNNDFAISSQEPTASTETQTTADAEAQKNLQKLDLSRSDFGDAALSVTQQNNQVQYQVKMPVNTLSPEKIKLIQSKSVNAINVYIGGRDFTGTFQLNLTGAPTELAITSAQSLDEAAQLRTYLNSGSFHLGYKQTSYEVYQPKYAWAKLAGLLALFLVAALVAARLTHKTLSVKQVMAITGITVITAAAFKLFGLAITTGVVVAIMTVLLMTLLQVRGVYFIGVGVALLIIHLLGYLYFMELNWPQAFVLIVASALIWSTKYYGKKNTK